MEATYGIAFVSIFLVVTLIGMVFWNVIKELVERDL